MSTNIINGTAGSDSLKRTCTVLFERTHGCTELRMLKRRAGSGAAMTVQAGLISRNL